MSSFRKTRLLVRTLQPVLYSATRNSSSSVPSGYGSGGTLSSLPLQRGLITNAEGNGPPRVLITGGLGQLGSGLAKVLR